MAEPWTIEHRGQNWCVQPFRSRATALRHAQDHYLDPREQWDQVDAAALRLRREVGSASDETKRASVVDEARGRYEAAIVRLTGRGKIVGAEVKVYREKTATYRSLMVATYDGLFVGFGEAASDLFTAYRPWTRGVVRGPLSVKDYRDNALRKLAGF